MIGFFNLSIKQYISWLKVLLQHYGASFMTSKKLQASLEAMQLEVGCRGDPLNKNYGKLGLLAMEGWVEAVWEHASYFGYTVMLDYPIELLPWERDCYLVDIFLESGKTGRELLGLNRCRTSYQANICHAW